MCSQQLSRFFRPMNEQGVEDLAFLRSMDEEEVSELCEEVGMRKMQRKRFLSSVLQLQAAPAPASRELIQAASTPTPPAPALDLDRADEVADRGVQPAQDTSAG